jgi:hypothetical protein
VQFEVWQIPRMKEKIFLKRQSAEFVLLNSTKENLPLHTKNVLSNGLASKETDL